MLEVQRASFQKQEELSRFAELKDQKKHRAISFLKWLMVGTSTTQFQNLKRQKESMKQLVSIVSTHIVPEMQYKIIINNIKDV